MGLPEVTFPTRQIVTAATLVVLALVALSFGRVLVAEYRLNLQEQALKGKVADLKNENQRLRAKVAYLQTDQAIEGLAREELGWTKPGDTAVVVLSRPTPALAMASTAPRPAPVVQTTWQRWWSLIGRMVGLSQ